MSTPHVIASSSSHPPSSTTSNGIVGNHYRVGKKIGEGSFGVVFEGEFRSYVFSLFPCGPSGRGKASATQLSLPFFFYWHFGDAPQRD
jgi:serine/threonine protein kinase